MGGHQSSALTGTSRRGLDFVERAVSALSCPRISFTTHVFLGFHLFSTFVAVESALFGASQQPNFFLNPQVFRGWGLILAADGLCEWLAIFEGSDPSPSPWAPCVVPNYSWIPFNKRQAGRQAGKQAPPP